MTKFLLLTALVLKIFAPITIGLGLFLSQRWLLLLGLFWLACIPIVDHWARFFIDKEDEPS